MIMMAWAPPAGMVEVSEDMPQPMMPAAGRLEKRASDVSRARVVRSSGPAPFPAAKARARGVRGHAARTGATGALDGGGFALSIFSRIFRVRWRSK
jgi:hypothetical protein